MTNFWFAKGEIEPVVGAEAYALHDDMENEVYWFSDANAVRNATGGFLDGSYHVRFYEDGVVNVQFGSWLGEDGRCLVSMNKVTPRQAVILCSLMEGLAETAREDVEPRPTPHLTPADVLRLLANGSFEEFSRADHAEFADALPGSWIMREDDFVIIVCPSLQMELYYYEDDEPARCFGATPDAEWREL